LSNEITFGVYIWHDASSYHSCVNVNVSCEFISRVVAEFVVQGYSSKFMVTRGKMFFFPLKVRVKLRKPVQATWMKSSAKLETANK